MNTDSRGTFSGLTSGNTSEINKMPQEESPLYTFVKKLIFILFIWKLVLMGIVSTSFRYLPFSPTMTQFIPGRLLIGRLPLLVWVWANFDGAHYLSIAKSGFFAGEYGFFPLYPFLIRLAFERTNIPHIVVAQALSIIFFFCSLIVLWELLRVDEKEHLSPLFFWIVFLFPTAFFYSAVYNDALFFLLANLTILTARRKQWLLAGLFGGLATLTRLNGVALMAIVAAEYMIVVSGAPLGGQWRLRSWRNFFAKPIVSILFIPATLVGYLAYIQRTFGSWQLVFSGMKIWNQDKVTFPLQVVWRYVKIIVLYPSFTVSYWVAVNEFLFFLLYVLLLVYAWKKIRLSYWIFFLLSILIPSLTGTFQGMPRYGLHLYPFFLVLTLLLQKARMRIKVIYFIWSIASSITMLSLFTLGYFVS